jgi:hypothetical protein
MVSCWSVDRARFLVVFSREQSCEFGGTNCHPLPKSLIFRRSLQKFTLKGSGAKWAGATSILIFNFNNFSVLCVKGTCTSIGFFRNGSLSSHAVPLAFIEHPLPQLS